MTHGGRGPAPGTVIGITSGDHRSRRDLISLLAGAARGGLPWAILREPQLTRRQLVDLYRRLVPAYGPHLLLHAGHPDALELAVACGAGLHLPAGYDAAGVRARVTGPLGQSCHNPLELAAARRAGCDYALLSPVFPPGCKPGDSRTPLGLDGLREVSAVAGLPVVALGGIDDRNAGDCLRAGATGVAAMTMLWPADATPEDCQQAAERLVAAAKAGVGPGATAPAG